MIRFKHIAVLLDEAVLRMVVMGLALVRAVIRAVLVVLSL